MPKGEFEKTIGTRNEVWKKKAQRTAGGLTKEDLCQNPNTGKIVSKKLRDRALERMKNPDPDDKFTKYIDRAKGNKGDFVKGKIDEE